MASLINAIAHPRPAAPAADKKAGPDVKADADGGRQIAGAAAGQPPTMLTVVRPGGYDIADALADVARAIAPKATVAAPEAAPKSVAVPDVAATAVSVGAVDVTPKAAATQALAATPKVVVAPKAVVAPRAVAAPRTVPVPRKASVVPTSSRATKPATKLHIEAKNDWQPIAMAPLDRNVQVGVTFKNGILAIFFPCRRTDAGWINAIVKAPLLHEPACWREWREDYFDDN